MARDSEMFVKVIAAMEMNPFMSIGHCAHNYEKDYVKQLCLQALSDSITDYQNRCPTEDLKTRMQFERSVNINRLDLGKVMKLQPSCE